VIFFEKNFWRWLVGKPKIEEITFADLSEIKRTRRLPPKLDCCDDHGNGYSQTQSIFNRPEFDTMVSHYEHPKDTPRGKMTAPMPRWLVRLLEARNLKPEKQGDGSEQIANLEAKLTATIKERDEGRKSLDAMIRERSKGLEQFVRDLNYLAKTGTLHLENRPGFKENERVVRLVFSIKGQPNEVNRVIQSGYEAGTSGTIGRLMETLVRAVSQMRLDVSYDEETS